MRTKAGKRNPLAALLRGFLERWQRAAATRRVLEQKRFLDAAAKKRGGK
jgi:hypothetical protein